MCRHHQKQNTSSSPPPARDDDFPWHLPIHDAHCHPTDTMASVAHLPGMRAATLAIMATRSQDQHLIAQVAETHGATESQADASPLASDRNASKGCRVVPSFGWHPWFSHQLYDDSAASPTYNPSLNTTDTSNATDAKEAAEEAAKQAHYQTVLSPTPKDPSFLSSLPPPTPLSVFLSATRARLTTFPYALIGEVGLDKAFRLPQQWDPEPSSPSGLQEQQEQQQQQPRDEGLTPGGREGRLLSPYRVKMQHQQAILAAQLRLAGELNRAASVHGVQAHGVLFDAISSTWKGHERKVLSRREKNMVARNAEPSSDDGSSSASASASASSSSSSSENNDEGNPLTDRKSKKKNKKKKQPVDSKPFPPRLCLHSYSGSSDMLKQWLHPSVPCDIYISFSTGVNLGTDGGKAKLADVVHAVPDDRILVESDLHTAGLHMEEALEDMYRIVCEIKGWELEDGVRRIAKNFGRFIYG